MEVQTIERPSGVQVLISSTYKNGSCTTSFLVSYKNNNFSFPTMKQAKEKIEEIENKITWDNAIKATEKEKLEKVVAEFKKFMEEK